MANAFDQFDSGNPFDEFDAPAKADPKIGQPEELSFAEKYLAPVLDRAGEAVASDPGMVGAAARLFGVGGDARGSTIGRLAKGASDPGVAAVQLGANAVGAGDPVNKAVAEREKQYQDARARSGSEGIDLLRATGQAGILGPLGAAGAGLARGAMVGGTASALTPVLDDPASFWKDKAKQVAIGAGAGAALSPLMGALARVVSPKASVDAGQSLLRGEGVKPTVGQTLGGWANRLEEKAQDWPIMGDAIRAARQRGADQLESAAFKRGGDPIGATITGRGHAGVAELGEKISAEYERVLPKMAVNALDDSFVAKLGNLRSMAQSLPEREAQQFDAILERELGQRMAPNGVLSGQNLKDAWRALRDKGNAFAKSPDPYQADLGQALKQAFQELKDHVTTTNPPENVLALKGADLAYANFKRLQRAAGGVGAEGGHFSPAQLHNAVKAGDRSKDKARFAEGDALMQDLSSAGKRILGNKVPDSGSFGRFAVGAGGVAAGMISPAIPAALVGGAVAYTPQVQNVLRALIVQRPEMAPVVANYLRQLSTPAALGTPLLEDF